MSLLLAIFIFAVVLMSAAGFYCLLATRNLIRILIALEIITKAVTLLLIAAGYVSGKLALAQTFVITLIIVEVVILAVTAGIVLGAFRHNKTLDIQKLGDSEGRVD